MTDLKGKTIWIIGASSGIGESTAKKLDEEGAILFLSSRNEEKLEEIKKSLKSDKHKVIAFDVTKPKKTEEAFKRALELGGFDILFYNSGFYSPMPSDALENSKMKDIKQTIDVNLKGFLEVISHTIPYFKIQKKGHIVSTASVAGYFGLPKSFIYGATKAAMINLSESMNAELSKYNIKVQTINPGFVTTPMTSKNDFEMPMEITPEKAADYIVKGLKSNSFEIHFPKTFSYMLKIIKLLPYFLFFPITRKISKMNNQNS